jgi:hypothetical protein
VSLPPHVSDAKRLEAYRELHEAVLLLLRGCGDFGSSIYAIREAEGRGWDGPRVRAWSEGTRRVTAALKTLHELREPTP